MRARPDDGQLTLVGIVIALVVVAALTGIGLVAFVGSGSGGGSSGSPQGPAVGTADDVSAQESLSQAQTAASTDGVANGYGSLDASALASIDPNVTFTAGPSTSSSAVSVAPSGGATAGAGASTGLSSGTGVGGGGSVTLASHSKTGTCWYLWLGSGGPVYGAQTGQSSCQAVATASPPAQGGDPAAGIAWSSGGFPRT